MKNQLFVDIILKSKKSEKIKNSYALQNEEKLLKEKGGNNPITEMNKKLNGYIISEYFEILNYIGKGGSGIVFQGKFKKIKTDKFAAIKFIIQKNSEAQRKNKNKANENHMEIIIHNRLKHKNIPEIYGFYQINEGTCIAMEFCKYDLPNFKKQILKKCFSETLICYISFQILEAILNLQKNHIIHLDIKPQNILIDEYLNVKLCDFSISLNYKSTEKNLNLQRAGTSYFISPEVLEEKTIELSEASKIDIYSFGVLIYLLSYYDYPYNLNKINDKDYPKILKNIQDNELEFPQKVKHSQMLQNFLIKCLEKDIKKRYNIFDAMADPWIKGHEFIFDEKEKLNNGCKFLMNMMADNIFEFNKYIKQRCKPIFLKYFF